MNDAKPCRNQAERIIAKFGGLTALARAAGYPVTTVFRWKESGHIRPEHNERILAGAAAQGIELTVEDFSTVDPAHPLLSAPAESDGSIEAGAV